MFKLNKLILYIHSNFFFVYIYYITLRNLKICKLFRNFDYILFAFIFFIMKPKKKNP